MLVTPFSCPSTTFCWRPSAAPPTGSPRAGAEGIDEGLEDGAGHDAHLEPFMSSGVWMARLLLVKWRTPLSANDSSRTRSS